MEKLRVGIVGTGYTVGIAAMHVKGYQSLPDECTITALFDIQEGRAAQWAREKNLDVKICASYEELLENVDVVSLCVPNSEHIPLLMKAFEAGKHVLCEKPISVDAQTAQCALEKEPSDRIHQVGFSYRGIPGLIYMKKCLDEGRIGRVFTYRETLGGCRIANPDVKLEWRMRRETSGTGALADFGCHMIDLCDWLLAPTQGRFTEVNGMTTCSIPERQDIQSGEMKPVSNDDSAAFTLRLENGAIASFVASRLGVLRHTLEIYGEGGMMLFRDDRPNEVEIWMKEKDGGYTGTPETIQVPEEMITIPWSNAEFRDFIHCIRNGEKPERSLERGVYVQKIVDAAEKACSSGVTVRI